jgi:hypothetical protein
MTLNDCKSVLLYRHSIVTCQHTGSMEGVSQNHNTSSGEYAYTLRPWQIREVPHGPRKGGYMGISKTDAPSRLQTVYLTSHINKAHSQIKKMTVFTSL